MEVALSEEGEGDFTDTLPETRTVTVPAGDRTITVGVATIDDAVDEPDGTIVARVVEPATVYTVGTPGTAEVVVQDGDLPAVTITADRTPITEGETASFTVSVSTPAPDGGLEVEVALSEEGEGDFTDTLPETRTVTVPAGDRTITVGVATIDDAVDEPDGTIVARVVEPATAYTVGTPGTAEVVVQDGDLPAVTITADRTPITEGETASFTVSVSTPAPDGGLEVEVALSEEGDFTDTLPETRTVTFPAGQDTVSVDVPTIDDAVDEPDGTIVARVVEPATAYTVGTPGTAEVVVQDGDLPSVTITADRTPITEGETALFTVSVSTPAPDGGLEVEVALSEEGEGDFTDTLPETRTVTVSPGHSTVTVSVATLDDMVDEPDGKIVARVVEQATAYTVGTPGTAEVVVQDAGEREPRIDPMPPAVTITADRTPITEGETASFTVTVSTPAPDGGLEVEVALSEEGNFTDTLPETRTVTVLAGDRTVTVSVSTIDDAVDEPDGKIVAQVQPQPGVFLVGDPGTAEVGVQDTDLAMVTITADRTPIAEGETASFTVSVSTPAPAGGLEVEVALSEEGEGDFTDTLPETRTVTVPAGDRTVTVSVATIDDAVDEPDGTIVARVVKQATVYTVGTPGTAEVVVQDTDLPAVTITADRTPITEGETASFTLSVSTAAPDGGLDVVVALSEEGEGDFTDTLPETRTVTVPAGQDTVSVDVPTLDDTVDEPDGTIVARVVEQATAYTVRTPGTAEVVVQDGDLPAVTIAAVTTRIAEGETASFTVSLSTSAPVDGLDVVVALSEEGEGDFTDTLPETRTVTVLAGQDTVSVDVPTLDDTVDEPDGTIVARVVEPATAYTVGDPGTAEVVVQDGDLPSVTITADRTPITEGETASFTVSVSTLAPDGGLDVVVALSEEGEGDFTDTLPETRTVTVPAGQDTVSVDVPTLDDAIDEPDGTIVARVVEPATAYTVGTPGTAEVVVQDTDLPAVTITADRTPITEGETALFTVSVSTPAPDGGLDVVVALSEEGEGDFTDTLPETRTVTVPAGQDTVSVDVPTLDDTVDEPDGAIVARVVERATAYAVGTPGTAEVVVQDNDLPAVTITADRTPITEGETASFTVSVSTPAPNGGMDVVVDMSQEGDSAVDTLPEARTVTVSAGDRTVTMSVATLDDAVDEPDGKIIARVVERATVYTVGDPGTAEVVMQDTDLPAVTITADRTPITEGDSASFTITVSTPALDGGLVVEVALSEEGEGDFTDTLPETRTVTVPPGRLTASVSVPTLDDTVDGPDGKIVAQVQPRPGVFLVGDPGTAEVVVQDPGDRGPRIDPDPIVPPTVTITAVTTPITEGETASFTVTVSTPAPDSGLDVEVALSEEGQFTATPLPETRMVTVSPGQFTASVSVATIDDAVDEPDGRIVARVIEQATAYTVGDPGAAEVVVQDADLPAVTIEVDRAPIAKGVPALFTEGEIVSFTLIISIPAPEGGLYLVVDLSEEGGGKYTDTLPDRRTVWVPPGQFTANTSVPTIEDSVDEPDGRIVARVQPQPGVFVVGDPGVAEVVVRDNDEPAQDDPTATIIEQVIPRVGRTVAGIVTRAIDCRRYSRFAEDHVTIGGLEVQPRGHATGEGAIAMGHPDAAAWNREGRRDETGMSLDEVLPTSSFAMTTPDREDDTGMAWWAEGAVAGFTGRYEALAMHGDVVSGVVGLEHLERDRRSGIAVARSIGDVEYSLPRFGTGTAHSSLTSLHPYVCWFPSDDTWMWGMLGYGWGVTSLSGAVTVEELDTSMRMGAFGTTGELLTQESWELVWKASAFAVSMRIDEAWGELPIPGDVFSFRGMVESAWEHELESRAVLRSALEVGGRYDGGDAETGGSLALGGGVRYTAPDEHGLTAEVNGHGLAHHADTAFEDWGIDGKLRFYRRTDGRDLSLELLLGHGSSGDAVRRFLEPDAALPLQRAIPVDAGARAGLRLIYGGLELGRLGNAELHGGLASGLHGSAVYTGGLSLARDDRFEFALEGAYGSGPRSERSMGLSLRLRW